MKNLTRKEIARETLEIIEAGEYRNNLGETVSIREQTETAVKNSRLFRTEDFPETFDLKKISGKMIFEVTDETTLEAAKRICKEDEKADPFVLNFASAKNPGGGFLGGAQAQEESLARSSALYPCLIEHIEMYKYNRGRKSCLYSDWMIYSPQVPVFRNDDGSLLQTPYLATFLTSPAVNAGVVRQREPKNVGRIEDVSRERARKFLRRASENGHRILILGAWGCGVFQNDPEMIARIFAELLKGEFAGCFERVIFAIYDRTPTKRVYKIFDEVCGK
ncbi:MAG: TIGR02452 family protein [Pyrinomonadaceae bacterium]